MSAIKGKYIDRGSSSRLSSPTSSTRLPTIASRRLDNFSFSIRRHSSFQENPEGEPTVLPLRYHASEELSPEPRAACRYKSVKEKREEADWLAHSLKMREVPQEELYRSRVGENLKHYGAGMLRRSHRNSLGLQASEQHLLELHYRLKRERETAIIEREERAAALRFRSMLSRYESI